MSSLEQQVSFTLATLATSLKTVIHLKEDLLVLSHKKLIEIYKPELFNAIAQYWHIKQIRDTNTFLHYHIIIKNSNETRAEKRQLSWEVKLASQACKEFLNIYGSQYLYHYERL